MIVLDWILSIVYYELSFTIMGLLFAVVVGSLFALIQLAGWVFRKVRDAWLG